MTKTLAEQAENLAVKRSTPNKLTKADLEAIRGLYEDPNRISVEAIGRLFGVSKVAVYKRALTLGWKQRTDDQARELGETILAAVHAKWQSIGVDENLNDNLGPNVDASRSPSSGAEKATAQQDSGFRSSDGSKSGDPTFTRDCRKQAGLPLGANGGSRRPVDCLPGDQVAQRMAGLCYRPPTVSAASLTAQSADDIAPLDGQTRRPATVIACMRVLVIASQLSVLERHQGLISRLQMAFEHFFDPLSVVGAMPDAKNLTDQDRVELACKIRSDAQQVITPTKRDTFAKTWKEMTDSMVKVFAMQRQALGLNTSNSSLGTIDSSLGKTPDISQILEQTPTEELATIQRFIAATEAVRNRDVPKPPPPG